MGRVVPPRIHIPHLNTTELRCTAMEIDTSWFFCAHHIYIHESYGSSCVRGESDVRTDISMVFIPHDGDIDSHHILPMLESLVEDIIMETKCQTLTS